MSKSRLTVAWLVLHVLGGIALVVSTVLVLDDLEVSSGAMVVAGLAIGAGWVAIGLLGGLLVWAVRDAVGIVRQQRESTRDLAAASRDQRRTLERMQRTHGRQLDGLTETTTRAADDLDAARADLARVVEQLQRLDRIETAVEQAALDDARAHHVETGRLDEVLERLPTPGEDARTHG